MNVRAAGEERGLSCGGEEYEMVGSENATAWFYAKASVSLKGKRRGAKQSQKLSISLYSLKARL